ncbi:MAG: RagB/SusD family nutrient uptake outer membrane protein, partial [Prevotella sp.]|nr:RagB/SusD family nutrient uptake outer membrane protein [Prevotella sp.]
MKRTLTILSATLLLTVFTSCGDFLDTLPLNDVVLENYWTEKKDVTSVLNSCYESLEDRESIIRMAVWGELRSENIVAGSSVPN